MKALQIMAAAALILAGGCATTSNNDEQYRLLTQQMQQLNKNLETDKAAREIQQTDDIQTRQYHRQEPR